MSVVDFTFKTFETVLQPVGWFKHIAYSLSSLKKEVCSFLNNYYQVDTFKSENYGIHIYPFGGFYIYERKSKEIIASSPDMKSNFIEIKLDNMQSKEFPKNQLNVLNTFCKVTENIYLWYVDNKIHQIKHIITLKPNKPENDSIETDDSLFIDICIIKKGDDTVTSLYKETYNFDFMNGNRVSLANYSTNYKIEDIFNEILREKHAVV